MVEDIEDGRCKVLFMTNRQAELVSKESDCIEKLLDALDVPKPGLVIDLLHSWGFYDSTTLQERTLIRTLTPSLNPPNSNPNPTANPKLDDAAGEDVHGERELRMVRGRETQARRS